MLFAFARKYNMNKLMFLIIFDFVFADLLDFEEGQFWPFSPFELYKHMKELSQNSVIHII